jgi:hypothetical protein
MLTRSRPIQGAAGKGREGGKSGSTEALGFAIFSAMAYNGSDEIGMDRDSKTHDYCTLQ